MSTVYFLGYLFYGHIKPSLNLVEELVNRGETVFYYTRETYREEVENRGATFRSYGEIDCTPLVEVRDNAFNNMKNAISWTLERNRQIMENIFPGIQQAVPDYIIHDAQAVWGKRIAKQLKIPAVSSIPSFVLTEHMFDRNPGYFLKNMFNFPGDLPVGKAVKYIKRKMKTMEAELAHKYRLEDLDIYDLPNGSEPLNIVYLSEYFQPFGDLLDDGFEFVGHAINTDDEASAGFDFGRLVEGPIIYISLGTVTNQKVDFYRMCFEAFGNGDTPVVLSVGERLKIEELGEIPGNFIVKNVVPQIEVLKRAGLFISHGGTNSVNEAFYFNVPLILIPQGADNWLIADRVESLKAGICLQDNEVTPKKLQEAARQVLSDDTYYLNSKYIGETLKTSGGVKRAVDEIFKYKNAVGIL